MRTHRRLSILGLTLLAMGAVAATALARSFGKSHVDVTVTGALHASYKLYGLDRCIINKGTNNSQEILLSLGPGKPGGIDFHAATMTIDGLQTAGSTTVNLATTTQEASVQFGTSKGGLLAGRSNGVDTGSGTLTLKNGGRTGSLKAESGLYPAYGGHPSATKKVTVTASWSCPAAAING